MQNMLHYLMRLRLHVSVLVPLSDPRAKAKASERQAKPRNLLYLGSEVHVAARSNQLLQRVRVPVTRRSVHRRQSILGGKGAWGGVVWWRRRAGVVDIYVRYTHTHKLGILQWYIAVA